MYSLQIVDDDIDVRTALGEFFEGEGYEVAMYPTGEDALNAMPNDLPNVVLLDLKLPGMDGFQVLENIKNDHPEIEVIIITGNVNVISAVKAMKLGAIDYVTKPFNLDEVNVLVHKAITAQQQYEQLTYLRQERQFTFGEIVGNSPAMEEVFRFIRQVADSPKTSVLIHGETGTGKELVARAIHYNSSRADKPFIEVNCSAFQDTLLESELFGYESGAFTGASQRKKGLLELAHGGSFFLDEIGEMSVSLQSKLLKVIEEQTFRRIGGTKEIKIDTRIFSATSRNLIKEVEENRFRKDLFYRLNVARIELPPLRERGEDVLLLADHFIKQYNLEFKRNISGVRKGVKTALMEHSWPGNVRELRNVIERAVLFEKGKYLSVRSIGFIDSAEKNVKDVQCRSEKLDVIKFDLEQKEPLLPLVEKELIIKVLKYYRYNLTQAARVLGVSRGSFRHKVSKLNINVDRDLKK